MDGRPSVDATRETASLVELVCSSTMISRPMTAARGSSAFSWSAINRRNLLTVDMIHFQAEIDRARGVGKCADGNVINAGGCDPPVVFQRNAATRFELDVVSSQRESFPNLCGLHVIQKDNVDAVDLDKSSRLLQIVGLDFDADIRSFLAKAANLIGKPGKPVEGCKMIVLYEDHIKEARTVINATASDNS